MYQINTLYTSNLYNGTSSTILIKLMGEKVGGAGFFTRDKELARMGENQTPGDYLQVK